MLEYRVSKGEHNCRLLRKQHGLPEPRLWAQRFVVIARRAFSFTFAQWTP
jgi:hypothetical protein